MFCRQPLAVVPVVGLGPQVYMPKISRDQMADRIRHHGAFINHTSINWNHAFDVSIVLPRGRPGAGKQPRVNRRLCRPLGFFGPIFLVVWAMVIPIPEARTSCQGASMRSSLVDMCRLLTCWEKGTERD